MNPLAEYRLRLGEKATLLPSSTDSAAGCIYSLYPRKIQPLYAAHAEYRPVADVTVLLTNRLRASVLLMLLSDAPPEHIRNVDYIRKMQQTLSKLGFGEEDIARIEHA